MPALVMLRKVVWDNAGEMVSDKGSNTRRERFLYYLL